MMGKFSTIRIHWAVRLVACTWGLCLIPPSAHAQWIGRQIGCYAPEIEANPNRPTVANPADITQYGVLEIEFGWDRASFGAGDRLSDLAGLLKFGLLCDVELRWTLSPWLNENAQAGGQTGTGDNWVGPQVRIYHQTNRMPSMAFSYAVKIPSASAEKGLGTGRVDQEASFLASKDIYKIHFDFNANYFFIGKPNSSGYDRNAQFNLSFSHTLKGQLGLTGEFYGDTELNAAIPGFASTLWALTYAIKPRLVVDAGIDVGLTHGAPQKRFFAGFTWAIANIYEEVKKHRDGKGAASQP